MQKRKQKKGNPSLCPFPCLFKKKKTKGMQKKKIKKRVFKKKVFSAFSSFLFTQVYKYFDIPSQRPSLVIFSRNPLSLSFLSFPLHFSIPLLYLFKRILIEGVLFQRVCIFPSLYFLKEFFKKTKGFSFKKKELCFVQYFPSFIVFKRTIFEEGSLKKQRGTVSP